MNNGPQGLHHGHGMGILPDVPAQVEADRAVLHPVVHKIEDFPLGLGFGPPAMTTGTGQPFTTLSKFSHSTF